jgi:hypothetical protein
VELTMHEIIVRSVSSIPAVPSMRARRGFRPPVAAIVLAVLAVASAMAMVLTIRLPAPAAPSLATPASAPRRAAGRSLAERLADETAARPAAIAVRAERAVAALSRAGLAAAPPQQVLAETVGASFCLASRTGSGLGISVCEFADADAAERGVGYSRRAFDRLVPHRRLERNGSTVLTISRSAAAPELDADAARAAAVFASL